MEAERWAHLEALEAGSSDDFNAHLAIARWIKGFITDGGIKQELLAAKAALQADKGASDESPGEGAYMESDSGEQGTLPTLDNWT